MTRISKTFSRFEKGVALCCLIVSHSSLVFPDDCNPTPVCSKIGFKAAVFVGRVLKTCPSTGTSGVTGCVFRFAIVEVFKGITKETTEIELIDFPGGAGPSFFQLGKEYLIFASSPSSEGFDKFWVTPSCGDVIPVGKAESAIQFLRLWANGKTQTQIYGSIKANWYDGNRSAREKRPVSKVLVEAVGDGAKYQTFSNQNGEFFFSNIFPGEYRIIPRLAGFEPHRPKYKAVVAKGCCDEIHIGMWTDSSLSGTVFEQDGRPAQKILIDLASSKKHVMNPQSVFTDASGRFKFRRIPPGEYLLGTNLMTVPRAKAPYDTTYFPGTTERAKARRVKVSGPDQIKNVDLHLGRRYSTRKISVDVRWWDGQPATNVEVACDSTVPTDDYAGFDTNGRYPDSSGHVEFDVLATKPYEIRLGSFMWSEIFGSEGPSPGSEVQNAPTFQVTPGSAPLHVELTIPKEGDLRKGRTPMRDAYQLNELNDGLEP